MSTIKSSDEHLTLNADGSSKDIKFQANGVEKASIDSSGNLTVSGNLTSVGIDDNADATTITISSAENVGIQTASPNAQLHIGNSNAEGDTTNPAIQLGGTTSYRLGMYTSSEGAVLENKNGDDGIQFRVKTAGEAMRIDTSGNVLVGKTALEYDSNTGHIFRNDGFQSSTRSGGNVADFNRLSSNGEIIRLSKDGTTVGSIGTNGGFIHIGSGDVNLRFHNSANAILPAQSGGASRDNAIDVGSSGARFDDIYATNGTIQTSDRNEKQDIEELSEAEQRVAVACKGLMRKFRWKSAVAEKGDEARTHFGIIAQDLQDAFTAEGLDAGDYAMFISTTWYEKEVEVDAVEAVEAVEATYDEDGNELTSAVEEVKAKDAYIRTDTEDEPTDGYTERTRLGVRYPELLAFIISAL